MNETELDEILNAWKAPEAPESLRAGLRSRLPSDRARRTSRAPLRWAAAFALAAGAVAIGTSLVKDGTLGSDAGPWDDHLYIRRTRMVRPAIAILKWQLMPGGSTGWRWEGGKLAGSRYLYDRWSHAHYGYTFRAQPLGTGQYLFTVQPLDPSVVKEDGPIVQKAPLPAPRIVGPGSAFDVDLYASGSERVYDHIEFSAQPLETTLPRTADTVTLTKPKLYINGQFAADSGGVGAVAGEIVYVDVPARGRHFLALDSHGDSRFLRAGRIRGNAIEFQSGGDQFRIECTAPIATGGDRPVFVFLQKVVDIRAPAFGAGGARFEPH